MPSPFTLAEPADGTAGSNTPIFVYADGASRGNPGPAGAGWVLCDAQQAVLAQGHLYLGRRTNNEAEYAAATLALKAALDLGFRHVVLRADSELLIKQLLGQYRVKNERLLPLYRALVALTRAFAGFRAEHVRRHLNQLADAQANAAVDGRLAAPGETFAG